MKKFCMMLVLSLFILSAMFVEYRFIMHNIKPYVDNNGALYLEVFGFVDEYYAESIY